MEKYEEKLDGIEYLKRHIETRIKASEALLSDKTQDKLQLEKEAKKIKENINEFRATLERLNRLG